MKLLIKTLVAVTACSVLATGAFAQSAVVPSTTSPHPG